MKQRTDRRLAVGLAPASCPPAPRRAEAASTVSVSRHHDPRAVASQRDQDGRVRHHRRHGA
eukprot:432943-Prymnesium_polylepis.1